MKQLKIFVVVILSLLTILIYSFPALAADTINGEKIFNIQCAGCHINGGNIIRRGKTLKQKALTRNKVDNLEAVASLVANGKNNMSAYKDRLTEQEIEDVSAYVLEQAAKNWR